VVALVAPAFDLLFELTVLLDASSRLLLVELEVDVVVDLQPSTKPINNANVKAPRCRDRLFIVFSIRVELASDSPRRNAGFRPRSGLIQALLRFRVWFV
jgi:hypothetical protein